MPGKCGGHLGQPLGFAGEIGPGGPVDLRVDEARGDEQPGGVEDPDVGGERR